MQQPVVEPRTLHLDPLGEHESPLELPRRDPAVQEDTPLTVVSLTPRITNWLSSCVICRSSMVKPATASVIRSPVGPGLLDVVGRIAVGRGLRGPLEHLLEMVEAQEQR